MAGNKLTWETLDAVAVLAPDGLPRDLVDPDEEDGVELLPEDSWPRDADPADLADLARRVGDVAVALAGRVELPDVGDAEALDELPPDVALEAVAEEAPHPVRLVPRRLGRRQQVAAHLPDVDGGLQVSNGIGGKREVLMQ